MIVRWQDAAWEHTSWQYSLCEEYAIKLNLTNGLYCPYFKGLPIPGPTYLFADNARTRCQTHAEMSVDVR